MTPEERRRWRAGRHDWRDQSWEDHCGDPTCAGVGNCCQGEIPRDDRVAALRASFERSILGAEVERL